jgi:hypothetical protein
LRRTDADLRQTRNNTGVQSDGGNHDSFHRTLIDWSFTIASSACEKPGAAEKQKREVVVRDMKAIENAAAATWDEQTAKMTRDWDALKSAVDETH